MRYRKLGNSGLQVSEIGFGCMSLEGNPSADTLLLRKAFDNGISYFDTADLYQHGENERIVGKALNPFRKDVIIATKAGNQWRPDGSGWDWNPSGPYILKAAEDSLKRLNTDYIDLFLLHGGTIDDPIDETIEAFERLKEQGKIRAYGISSIRPNVIREYVRRASICAVMMQYSLLDRRPEEECLKLLAEHGIGLLARGTLAKGLLAGKPAEPYLDHTQEEVNLIANRLREISGYTMEEVALGFVLAGEAVSSAVVGIRTADQLDKALAVAQKKPLHRDQLLSLIQGIPAKRYKDHR